MLDAVLLNMRDHGRIAGCGMTTTYNLDEPEGIKILMFIIYKRIRMEGFSAIEYYHLYPKFLDHILPYIRETKLAFAPFYQTIRYFAIFLKLLREMPFFRNSIFSKSS